MMLTLMMTMMMMMMTMMMMTTMMTTQADHPLCLRPRDVCAIRYLISYIFCNLLRLTSD